MELQQVPLTAAGMERLSGELVQLKKIERPQVIEEIAEARSHGDLKENAEYHAAREKQGMIEARISELEDKLSRATVIDFSNESPDIIKFGASVTVSDEDTGEEKQYQIVGDLEANIDKNMISLSSPIAKALMGKKIDDLVEVRVPKGTSEYVILEIKY